MHLNEREFGEVDMLVFSRHEEVRTLLGDARFQFGFIDGTQMYDTMAGFMPHRHGSEHARLRRAVAAPFTPKHVRTMQSAIERVVEEALDVLEQAGPGADLVSKFALPVPSRIIGEILGVPSADHLKFNEITAGITDTSLSPEGYMAAMVLVSLLNANRDPALAEGNPDELDLTRGPVAHVAFGHGAHQCPGQHLARFEPEIALPALFRRLPTLKLAVPREDLEFNRSGIIYGLKELPVKW